MLKKTINLFFLFLFVFGLFWSGSFVLGQIGNSDVNDEVKQINDEIRQKKKELEKIQEQKDEYSRLIEAKQQEQITLANQLAILDNRLAKAELDLESAQIEIDRLKLEINKVNSAIESKEAEIEIEKKHIADVLRIMYKQKQTDTLEIILLNNSLADFLNQVKYLEDTNEEIGNSVDKLKTLKKQLENEKEDLAVENEKLEAKKEDLEQKKEALEAERNNKDILLAQVQNSEYKYKTLLERSKEQQRAAAADISSLEKTVRAKIEQAEGKELTFNDQGLVWPVTKNVVTAYFHDPEYPFRYIFEHPAIDIRAGQSSNLKAAASGYVARAKNGGVGGYSYIMIVHGDGLSTVYGHVSEIYVKEDEYVVQGQSIGRSGGMPGTPGAGNLTTGPHLHFEVRKDGIPVNPLEYLP